MITLDARPVVLSVSYLARLVRDGLDDRVPASTLYLLPYLARRGSVLAPALPRFAPAVVGRVCLLLQQARGRRLVVTPPAVLGVDEAAIFAGQQVGVQVRPYLLDTGPGSDEWSQRAPVHALALALIDAGAWVLDDEYGDDLRSVQA